MSRLTKNIRLVLLSSSLVLPGCGRHDRAYAPRRAGGPNANMPTACGPVDGRTVDQPGGIRAEAEECYVDGSGGQVGNTGAYVDSSGRHVNTHVGHPVGHIVPIGGYGSRTQNFSGNSTRRTTTSNFSSSRSSTSRTTSSRSSIGSVRGGFGSSAHGVSS